MAKTIIINAKTNIVRAAVIEDKKLDNLFIDRNDTSSIVGNVYLGRIDRLMPSIQAAFIDIGIGKNGFLQLLEKDFVDSREKSKKHKEKKYIHGYELSENKNILIQVTKEEIGKKGVRLDSHISLPGRFLVLMPYGHGKFHLSRKIINEEHRDYISEKIISKMNIPDNVDVIIRTAAAGVKAKFIIRDLENLLESWYNIQKSLQKATGTECLHEELDLVKKIVRDWFDDDVGSIFIDNKKSYEDLRFFVKKHLGNSKVKIRSYNGDIEIFDKFGITRQIEKLYERKTWLPCGGYLVIDKTEALVAIDVNTGKNIHHDKSSETILETNMQAAEEIARQLRIRNMGGIVIIDFIDMRNKFDQKKVLKHLSSALEKDKAKSKVYPFTRLGLVQMTRQRVEESWEQHYFVECVRCEGTGRILSIPVICEQIISQIKRFLVINPGVNLNIRANSEIIGLLLEEKRFEEVEKKFGIEIGYLKDDNSLPEKYIIVRKDTGTNILKK